MAPEVMRGKGYGLEVDVMNSISKGHDLIHCQKAWTNVGKDQLLFVCICIPRFGRLEYCFMRTPCMFAILRFGKYTKLSKLKSRLCRLLCGQLPFGENAENDREALSIHRIIMAFVKA